MPSLFCVLLFPNNNPLGILTEEIVNACYYSEKSTIK